MLIVFAVLLAGTLLLSQVFRPEAVEPEEGVLSQEEQLLNAVLDRIGATRWSEAIGWYEMQEAGLLGDGSVGEDTPVWASRDGHGPFHSVPICSGLKAPVQRMLAEAIAEGRLPCDICWEQIE